LPGSPFSPTAGLAAGPRAGRRFFTKADLELLDALTEIIIPSDEHSPGARAAGVARDLDRRLAETSPGIGPHRRLRAQWRAGLRSLERLALGRYGARFVVLSEEKQSDLVATFAAGEVAPTTDDHRFFVALKEATARAYYTSETGIHEDMQYKGNSYFDEFQGHDVLPLRR
jgi:hypothetical protein